MYCILCIQYYIEYIEIYKCLQFYLFIGIKYYSMFIEINIYHTHIIYTFMSKQFLEIKCAKKYIEYACMR